MWSDRRLADPQGHHGRGLRHVSDAGRHLSPRPLRPGSMPDAPPSHDPLEREPCACSSRHDLRRDLRSYAGAVERDLCRHRVRRESRAFPTRRSSSSSTTTRRCTRLVRRGLPGRHRGRERRGARTVGRQEHRRRLDPRATSSPFSTTTPSPTPTGSSSSPTRTPIPSRHRRRWPHLARLEDPAPVLVPEGVRLGRRLHLPRHGGIRRTPVRNLLGGNASFRREAFALAGGFQNGIGRSAGKRPLGCEETEFCIRLNQQSPGSVLLFDDRAMIWHLVPPDRMPVLLLPFSLLRRGTLEGAGHGQCRRPRRAFGRAAVHDEDAAPGGVPRGTRDVLGGDLSGLGRAGPSLTGCELHGGRVRRGLGGEAGTKAPGQRAHESSRRARPGWRVTIGTVLCGCRSSCTTRSPRPSGDQQPPGRLPGRLRRPARVPPRRGVSDGDRGRAVRRSWPAATAQLPDRAVVLTFDDGYADFHSRAMPLLDRYGFTATRVRDHGLGARRRVASRRTPARARC